MQAKDARARRDRSRSRSRSPPPMPGGGGAGGAAAAARLPVLTERIFSAEKFQKRYTQPQQNAIKKVFKVNLNATPIRPLFHINVAVHHLSLDLYIFNSLFFWYTPFCRNDLSLLST